MIINTLEDALRSGSELLCQDALQQIARMPPCPQKHRLQRIAATIVPRLSRSSQQLAAECGCSSLGSGFMDDGGYYDDDGYQDDGGYYDDGYQSSQGQSGGSGGVNIGNIVNTALNTGKTLLEQNAKQQALEAQRATEEARRKALEAQRATEEARRANTPPANANTALSNRKAPVPIRSSATTAKKVPWGWIIGGTLLVSGTGVGLWYWNRSKQSQAA